MSALNTRAELEAALAKAERTAKVEVLSKMGPSPYDACTEAIEDYILELNNRCSYAVHTAQEPIWAAWHETPQGKEEVRLAEEAERRRMEEKQALAEARLAENQAKRLAYAKSQGFDTVIAYIDYVNSTWRYCHKNPWVSWLTCVRRVQVPEWW